jgi:hypothetical protein
VSVAMAILLPRYLRRARQRWCGVRHAGPKSEGGEPKRASDSYPCRDCFQIHHETPSCNFSFRDICSEPFQRSEAASGYGIGYLRLETWPMPCPSPTVEMFRLVHRPPRTSISRFGHGHILGAIKPAGGARRGWRNSGGPQISGADRAANKAKPSRIQCNWRPSKYLVPQCATRATWAPKQAVPPRLSIQNPRLRAVRRKRGGLPVPRIRIILCCKGLLRTRVVSPLLWREASGEYAQPSP